MSIMNQPVEYCDSKGRIWEAGMPLLNGDLADSDGGRAAKTIIQQLKKILGIRNGNDIVHPVIQDDQNESNQIIEKVSEGSIQVSHG